MQTNVVPGAGQVLKIAVIFVIILLFISFLSFGLPFSLRTSIYKVFKKGAYMLINYQTASFGTLESEHFVLKYSKEDRDISAFVLDTAEKYCLAVREMMNYWPEQRGLIIIYHDQKDLNKSFGWAADKSTAGAYWAGSIRILSPHAWSGKEEDADSIRTAFLKQGPLSHELTHYIIDEMTGGNYSRWLSEGLAQYVEEKTTGFHLDEPPLKQQKNPYPLALLEREYDKLPDQTLVYWQSLQVVRYLIDGYGMEQMHVMLALLGKGADMEEALQKTYSMSVSELETKIKDKYDRL